MWPLLTKWKTLFLPWKYLSLSQVEKLRYIVKWKGTTLSTLALRATCFQGKRRCGFPTETHRGTIPRKIFFSNKIENTLLNKSRYKDGQKWTQHDWAWGGGGEKKERKRGVFLVLSPVIKLVDSALELRASYVLTKADVERLSEPAVIDRTLAVTL